MQPCEFPDDPKALSDCADLLPCGLENVLVSIYGEPEYYQINYRNIVVFRLELFPNGGG